MATDTGYAKGDYLRICDICGHRFHFSALRPIGELKWACPDDAPGLTALQISKFNAKAKPVRVRPNRWPKPLAHTPTYQWAEADVFNYLLTEAAANTSTDAAAWTAIYMAETVSQGLRPARWLETARDVLDTCCTFILTQQFGSPTGISPSGTVDDPRYGGVAFTGSTAYLSSVVAVCGAALVKAYSVTREGRYLDGAKRCATFLRHMQCGDLHIASQTVFPVGGSPYHIGGVANGVNTGTAVMVHSYLISDVIALWFLGELADVVGAETAFGDAAATAHYSGPTQATLTTMMSELLAFAVSGARSATTGELQSALSTTAPRETYVAATSLGTGTATWTVPTNITTVNFARALRGIYAHQGVTSLVSAIISWLQAFSANSANAIPATTPESQAILGIKGTYDATLCPAVSLTASAPFTEATGTLYDWASFGILSPILTTISQTNFKRSKDALSTPRRVSLTGDINSLYLGPYGRSGLNFQVRSSATTATKNMAFAARTALAYRQAPGNYPQLDN